MAKKSVIAWTLVASSAVALVFYVTKKIVKKYSNSSPASSVPSAAKPHCSTSPITESNDAFYQGNPKTVVDMLKQRKTGGLLHNGNNLGYRAPPFVCVVKLRDRILQLESLIFSNKSSITESPDDEVLLKKIELADMYYYYACFMFDDKLYDQTYYFYQKAIQLYNSMLKQPCYNKYKKYLLDRCTQSLLELSDNYMIHNDYEAMLEVIKHAETLNPTYPPLQTDYGSTYFLMYEKEEDVGKKEVLMEKCLFHYDKALEAEPNNSYDIHCAKGYINVISGNYHDASMDLETAMGIAPKKSKAYQYMFNLHSQTQEHDKVVELIDKAFECEDFNLYRHVNTDGSGHIKPNLISYIKNIDSYCCKCCCPCRFYNGSIENRQYLMIEFGTYFTRGFSNLALGNAEEAIKDLTTALELKKAITEKFQSSLKSNKIIFDRELEEYIRLILSEGYAGVGDFQSCIQSLDECVLEFPRTLQSAKPHFQMCLERLAAEIPLAKISNRN